MGFLKRFARGELHLTRIEAFSDGVFAIIVTLLVLELKVPILHDPHNAGELGRSLVDLLPKLLSWLISFIIVCKFWLNHHHIFGFARHATYGLVWLNSLFLLTQSFIPFPTALMGEYPGNPLAVSFFGTVMAINTLMFIAVFAYILRHVLKPARAASVPPGIIAKSFVGVLFYLLGASAAWLNVHLAFGFYLITPLFFIVPPSNQGRPEAPP
jgi:uncharacterized membrane protein